MVSCHLSALALRRFAISLLVYPVLNAAAGSSPEYLNSVNFARNELLSAPVLVAQVGGSQPNDNTGSEVLKFEIRDYRAEGNTLLDDAAIKRLLAPFTGKNRDFGDVQRALEALQDFYRESGYSGIKITLPEQELERGEVTFKVVESRIARVLVEGNQHFSVNNVRRSVPSLQPGLNPMAREIARSVRVANESPAKQSAVLLRPGSEDSVVDAVIRVADVPPVRYSVSIDNTGNEETGRYRTAFALQHANLFDKDHVLTGQFITSPHNLNDVQVFGVGYRIPLYALGDSIDLIAGYSTVDSGTVQNLFNVSGQGAIYAARYNQNLRRIGDVEHRLTYGLDYRAYQNLVTSQGGTFNFVPDITVHPLSLTYSAQAKFGRRELGLYAAIAQNIPGGNDGTDDVFKKSRAEATAAYRTWRLGGTFSGIFHKDWQLRIKVDAQLTNDALIAAEQFGLGGAESVRGFNERYSSNDKGYRSNWEIYTPELGTSTGFTTAKLRMLVFYDTGHVMRNFPQPGEPESVSLDSAGFGLRMNYGTNFSVKADYARVRHDGTQQSNQPRSADAYRWHVTIAYVF